MSSVLWAKLICADLRACQICLILWLFDGPLYAGLRTYAIPPLYSTMATIYPGSVRNIVDPEGVVSNNQSPVAASTATPNPAKTVRPIQATQISIDIPVRVIDTRATPSVSTPWSVRILPVQTASSGDPLLSGYCASKSVRPRETAIPPPVVNNPIPERTSTSIMYTPNPYHERESALRHSGESGYCFAAWHRISRPS